MDVIKKKVAFHTLGCKLNFAETSTISRSFPENKFERVPAGAKADIYVINTCSVTDAADRKCRQAIRKFIHQSPESFIIVVGCYSQLNPQEISSIPGVDLVLGTNEKFNISGYLNKITKKQNAEVHACGLDGDDSFYSSFSLGDRTRSFLKVQDGCDYGCSYCTVPLARGRSRNQTISSLVKEVELVAARGVKEVVITGVNVGDFGKSTGESLVQLLRQLTKINGIERYRISSIEPNLITDELLETTAGSDKILPHFHIPLQSGSDKVLGLMKRRYRSDLFRYKVLSIKKMMPMAGIGADVIVGFPGETDEEFESSFNFINEMPLSYLHVFNFSERPGTAAEEMPGKIPFSVREHRSKRLISLSKYKHLEFCKMNIGRVSKVLFEHTRSKGMITGFSENYLRVEHPWEKFLAGAVTEVKLTGISGNGRLTSEVIGT
ncbi:MAG: tRNA (N(6)-L-threonylcarbamoyladenosine(37)-C(2))-methylthiotransferase MtaB [Bacteroidota bacterium]|nr:tRNA (N(6)-L-threonylcarbamoyladenosine(37)-C(2))-methylthiotransferase MtaB [Bacteroidota bacterium]